MFGAVARKLFGSANERRIRSYLPRVDEINALEDEVAKLSDEALRARTDDFKRQVAEGVELNDILVPAFATVREAAKRTLGQRHFDVQLVGGMILHDGKIAEMKTGEGKTLVATLAVYLNALTGRGVHVVTVNDYLARRDADWMGQIYKFLGLTVGVIVHGIDDEQRKAAYDCDITYGTNNELGFDYLRDNMKYRLEDMVQRGHIYAIVDEVDSILVDEARTPLIISGPLDDRSDFYNTIDAFIPNLDKTDYEVDEKQRTVTLTEAGMEKLEQRLRDAELLKGESLYDVENVSTVHHVNQALRAHKLFNRDKDYIVRNGEVVIIDEFTGRMMPGRRYSDGLHQALEAKEHQPIQPENQTLASITFQNYFRMYEKLAGMTGTAATEADEFMDIYGLEVLEVPTNMPLARVDDDDEVYRTAEEKYRAVLGEIQRASERFQPVLVGTASIEKSELLASILLKNGFKQIDFENPKALERLYAAARSGKPGKQFAVLNARFHEQEAYIIAEAGVPGAITIATNMAGRGTDIKLGGNVDMRVAQETADIADPAEKEAKIAEIRAEVERFREIVLKAEETIEIEPAKGAKPAKTVVKPGGLYIVGTERHESRRIDNQLRGRSGRQGDPGRSKFYPVARGRPDADLRVEQARRHAAEARPQGGRGDHPSLDQQGAGKGAAEGRGAQLRYPQEPAQVRQRDERPAQGDLRAARRPDARRERRRDRRRHAPRRGRGPHRQARARERLSRAVGREGAQGGSHPRARPRRAGRRMGEGGGHRRRGADFPRRAARRRAHGRQGRPMGPRRAALRREIGSAADARSPVARASADARPFAQRDRVARLRPARSVERVQVGSLHAVRSDDHRICARRSPPSSCGSRSCRRRRPSRRRRTLPYMEAHKVDPTTGEDEMALAMAGGETLARHGITGSGRARARRRTTRRAGARSAATRTVPAARASATSIATDGSRSEGPLKRDRNTRQAWGLTDNKKRGRKAASVISAFPSFIDRPATRS